MIKNYFVIAYRNVLKNKIPSTVNIVGLSVAIACAIVVFLFLERQYTMDRFHENGENIFLVENIVERSNGRQLYGDSPLPLGPALEKDFPQIRSTARQISISGTFQAGEQVLRDRLWFVDDTFLEMFSFGLRLGDPSAIRDPGAIVLSDAVATKYFGDTDPIGKQISVAYGNGYTAAFTVRGVAEKFPEKASFTFRALTGFVNYAATGVDLTDWSKYIGATFIEVNQPDDIETIAAQMDRYLALQNSANEDWPIAEFAFDNLYNLSRNSQNVYSDISGGTHPAAIIVLGLVAIFLLALSSFNYINLAIANSVRRLKEIGIRKVVGGSKRQLVGQFLSENLLMALLALGFGFVIAYFLFIPGFNKLFDFVGGGISLGEADPTFFWIFLVALLVLTGLISGAYPAFYIASFRPSAIFRGSQTIGGQNKFTRSLLTLQFSLAFLTMIMGVILAQNASYQANRDWGYENEHRLVLRLQNGGDFAVARNAVSSLPDVQEISGSRNHLGRSWSRPVLDIEGIKMEAVRFEIGPGYLEQYDLNLIAGKPFTDGNTSAPGTEVIINETFADERNWSRDDVVDKSFRIDSTAYTVRGMVADFMYDSFYDPISPAFFVVATENKYQYLSMTLLAGSGVRTSEAVQKIWKDIFPALPYTGFFQDEIFDSMYRENTNIKQLFSFIALLALIIACLGLFALSVQNILHRMKEISIRKVLGATLSHVTRKVNTGFVIMIAVGAAIASPLGYIGMRELLDSVYSDPVPITAMPFLLSFSLVFLAAALTIATQIYRIAYANPAEVLRNE
jgi:putative ABC transport system permease protein